MPQPYRGYNHVIGPETFLKFRPDLAPYVAQFISIYASTEITFTEMFARTLKVDEAIALELYLIINQEGAKGAVFNRLLEQKLQGTDLFKRVTDLRKKFGQFTDRRNDFVHGAWGFARDLPDGLILIGNKDTSRWLAANREMFRKIRTLPRGTPIDRPDIPAFFYSDEELKKMPGEILNVQGEARQLEIAIKEQFPD